MDTSHHPRYSSIFFEGKPDFKTARETSCGRENRIIADTFLLEIEPFIQTPCTHRFHDKRFQKSFECFIFYSFETGIERKIVDTFLFDRYCL